MKAIKSILLTAACFILLCSFNGKNDTSSEWRTVKSEGLHGKVKSVSTIVYLTDSDNSGRSHTDTLSTEISLYSEAGNRTYQKRTRYQRGDLKSKVDISQCKFNDNGMLVEYEGLLAFGGKMTYEYDGENLLEHTAYDRNGKLMWRDSYFYENGILIRKEQVYGTENRISNIEFYDSRGNSTEIIFLKTRKMGPGNVQGRHLARYDERNNLTWETETNYATKELRKASYRYDDWNNLIEETHYRSSDSSKSRDVYKYDTHGDKTESFEYDREGNLTGHSTWKYKYNEEGILIKKVENIKNGDRITKITESNLDLDSEGNYLRKTYVLQDEDKTQTEVCLRKIEYYK
jgi:hypothetical protein